MISRYSVLTAMLLAGCAHAPQSGPAVERSSPAGSIAAPPQPNLVGVTARNSIVPLIDAHQHMMGPAAMSTLKTEPLPPAVILPSALADLLEARQRGVDEAGFVDVYTTDAQIFSEEQGRWWSGKERIVDSLANFGTGFRFIATSFSADASSGFIAGYMQKEPGKETDTFMLGVARGPDGRWRIASEMKQPIMPPVYAPSITADKIIEVLDDAGIRYATVLSTAYWFGDPDKDIALEDRIAGIRAENDWVIAEARRYPDRLIPFCGVNPVADYAIAEMSRCADLGVRGMKVHRNSKFDPANPQDLQSLQRFFKAANSRGMALVIHLRGDPQLYIDHIFPQAPDVPIQIAHMGSGFGNTQILAKAIQQGAPGTQNLWFDWTQALPIAELWGYGPSRNLSGTISDEDKRWVAGIMRDIGLDRILYGTDMPLAWNPTPREWWRKTILTLPLTDEEIGNIADNLPPYVPQ